MFTTRHRTLVCLTATVVALGLLSAPPPPVALAAETAQAPRLGPRPSVGHVRHFQLRSFQELHWSRVRGARSYQILVKQAGYDERLRRAWTPLKTVPSSSTHIHVSPGQTRQFGVRAVGARNGGRYRVTGISDFGTISRPARLSAWERTRKWRTVRNGSLYRNVALGAHRPRAKLRLPYAKGTSTIRLVGVAGRRYGTVDVYVGDTKLRRVDFGRRKHNPRKRVLVRVTPARSGTITLVTRSRKRVRISVIGHTRHSTLANRRPPAPAADPPARSFTFTGSGWGHGVGLSQYGANAMADAGKGVGRILRHYYEGTNLDTVADDKPVDVNVGYQSSSVTARLRGLRRGAELEVCAMNTGRCTKSAILHDRRAGARPSGKISLTRSRGKVLARVTSAGGGVSRVRGDGIRVRWSGTRYLDGKPAVLRLGNGREYRHGELLVSKHARGQLNSNVRMRLQTEYLRGVAEMPSSWNVDALRAQAVIARTYALIYGAKRTSDCDCHLRDSVVNQSYLGWAKESEGSRAYYGRRWVGAVNSTDGRVVKYQGRLAGTFYFSSSGGHTLNSQDVWSSTIPYLRSVADKWSMTTSNPNRTWSTRRSQASVSSMIGLKDIHEISVTRRFKGGAVRAITATSSNGRTRTISGKADYMRSRFGLMSPWLTSVDERF